MCTTPATTSHRALGLAMISPNPYMDTVPHHHLLRGIDGKKKIQKTRYILSLFVRAPSVPGELELD